MTDRLETRFEIFTALIASINHNMRKLKTEVMAEFDLRSAHLYCLYYLYRDGELTPGELCELCTEDKASISRSLRELEGRGYLCASESSRKYRKPVTLTESGREIGKKISERAEGLFLLAGDGLSSADREVLYRGLSNINIRLIELCDKYED